MPSFTQYCFQFYNAFAHFDVLEAMAFYGKRMDIRIVMLLLVFSLHCYCIFSHVIVYWDLNFAHRKAIKFQLNSIWNSGITCRIGCTVRHWQKQKFLPKKKIGSLKKKTSRNDRQLTGKRTSFDLWICYSQNTKLLDSVQFRCILISMERSADFMLYTL